MKGLSIYDVKELFSKAECGELATKYGFSADTKLYGDLKECYSHYMHWSEAEAPPTPKQAKNAFKAISTNADKLIASLDLPLFESAVLHSRLDVDRDPLIRLLGRVSELAGELEEALEVGTSGRRMMIENQFIRDLFRIYQKSTDLSGSGISDNPAREPDQQFNGNSLEFIRCCTDKAGIWKTDAAINQLIKRKIQHN
jgi:hypothetical protein